ncbi:unnamed protein product [Clonostachys rosea]|uniref:Uncharacterized protein n=1 Tax=Bionectria ochroleuca TaxID=29856 RepID=A0ABY6U4B8_BIOOC|nr:unnamed protein product [Clonostachys rosea]
MNQTPGGRDPQFRQEIQQMMWVAGEENDPSTETILLIESIVREQVVQMLVTARDLAHRRGAALFSNNDVIFQIRHDDARVERIRAFLTWKSIRKKAKNEDEKEIEEHGGFEDESAEMPSDDAIPSASSRISAFSLPWDVESMFRVQVPEDTTISDVLGPATFEKLQRDDERTRHMSVDEYATWSEYRHASFTGRRVKRFREWAGLGKIADHKPNDDVLDILGFLTSEMVQMLTSEALRFQKNELETSLERQPPSSARDDSCSLFLRPDIAKPPIEPRHVLSASQRILSHNGKRKRLGVNRIFIC